MRRKDGPECARLKYLIAMLASNPIAAFGSEVSLSWPRAFETGFLTNF